MYALVTITVVRKSSCPWKSVFSSDSVRTLRVTHLVLRKRSRRLFVISATLRSVIYSHPHIKFTETTSGSAGSYLWGDMTRTCFLFPGSRRTTQLPAADVLCISIVDVVRRPSARGSVSAAAQVQKWCYQIKRATFPTTVVDDLSIVVKSVLSTTIWFGYVTQKCRMHPLIPGITTSLQIQHTILYF